VIYLKIIGKPKLLDRLVDRYGLRDFIPERFLMSETIIPVTNMDELSVNSQLQKTSASGVNRTDNYTVPDGKRWVIKEVTVERSYTGNNQLRLTIDSNLGVIYAENTTGLYRSSDITLNQGDCLDIICNTGTTGTITTCIVYIETDVF